MHIFFADDSTQNRPSRPGMGSLLGAGGFSLANVVCHRKGGLQVCMSFGISSQLQQQVLRAGDNSLQGGDVILECLAAGAGD